MQEAVRHHDMTALTHGKFTGEGPRGVTVTRIVPFNKTLAVRHAKTIKKWQREYKGGVKKFLLNRLVDFSIKWVGGVWGTAGPLRKMMTCEKRVG